MTTFYRNEDGSDGAVMCYIKEGVGNEEVASGAWLETIIRLVTERAYGTPLTEGEKEFIVWTRDVISTLSRSVELLEKKGKPLPAGTPSNAVN